MSADNYPMRNHSDPQINTEQQLKIDRFVFLLDRRSHSKLVLLLIEDFLYLNKIYIHTLKIFLHYLLHSHWYMKVVLVHQLDIFLRHEFHLDRHLVFFDLDHKQGDRKTDPVNNFRF